MGDSRVAKIGGTWGGIFSGIAALITAIGLNVFDTAGDQAEKADQKSEMVLDLIRDQLKSAENDRDRFLRELEYQRTINAKLFNMVTELRLQINSLGTHEQAVEAVVVDGDGNGGGGAGSGSMGYGSGGSALSAAIKRLPPEDQFDLPEPPPKPPAQQKASSLPTDLEDLFAKQ